MMANRSSSSKGGPWSGSAIRSAFLDFYAQRDHQIIPSSSLVPDDPTVLLTIAGMLPFKPAFLGQVKPPALRATSSQKCIRTNDIENVGRTARHHTFFEMLGNFSFGDYFKREAILWAWELIIDVFGLDKRNLIISVFREDNESVLIWRDEVGVNPKRIIRMDEADNFWSSGPTGPCGPCSEIYYDFKPQLGEENIDLEDDSRFIEFYNLVFMQYNRDAKGLLTPLANFNIDTGMGLERMAQILQNVPNNYETDLIFPLIQKAASLAKIDYHLIDIKRQTSLKVIGDHIRAVILLVSDGVTVSNLGRGYILRRLIRRIVRHSKMLGIQKPCLKLLGEEAILLMKDPFPELKERKSLILSEIENEESRFLETLERGERLLGDLISANPSKISGSQAFELYDTYGFPLELTQEIAEEKGLQVDKKGFEDEMSKQRQRAKEATVSLDLTLQDSVTKALVDFKETLFTGYEKLESLVNVLAIVEDKGFLKKANAGQKVQIILDATPFYGESGGQLGDCGLLLGEELIVAIDKVTKKNSIFLHSGYIERGTIKIGDHITAQVDRNCRAKARANHTATHLLQSALKLVVDSNIAQKGSLVAFDRLRFDFNSPRSIKRNELEEIEQLINTWINQDHKINIKTMPIKKAIESGALAMFGEKYGETVRVVDVPGVSMELCGGTHISNTAELGAFKIIGESGVAAGIRRIEAIAGPAILDYLNERDEIVKQLSARLKAQPADIVERVASLQHEIKNQLKEIAMSKQEIVRVKTMTLLKKAITIGCSQMLVERLDGIDGASLQAAAQDLVNELGENTAVVLAGLPDVEDTNKVIFVVAFGPNLVTTGLKAGEFIGAIAKLCGGGGGGRPHLAQAGGRDSKALSSALEVARQQLSSSLP